MDLPPAPGGRGLVQGDSEWEEGVRSGQVAAWEVCREERQGPDSWRQMETAQGASE